MLLPVGDEIGHSFHSSACCLNKKRGRKASSHSLCKERSTVQSSVLAAAHPTKGSPSPLTALSPVTKHCQHWTAPRERKHQPQPKHCLGERPNGAKEHNILQTPQRKHLNALKVSMRHKPPPSQGVHIPLCSEQVRQRNSNKDVQDHTERKERKPPLKPGFDEEHGTKSSAGVNEWSCTGVALGICLLTPVEVGPHDLVQEVLQSVGIALGEHQKVSVLLLGTAIAPQG